MLEVLAAFGRPRTAAEAVKKLSDFDAAHLRKTVARLSEMGFLLPAAEAKRRTSRIRAWRYNLASAHYYVASRDIRYLSEPAQVDRFLTAVASRPRPARFKRYAAAQRKELPSLSASSPDAAALGRILLARQTVRRFSRRPVPLADFSAVVRGTWGATGYIDAGSYGRFTTKTSPSAGGLHPIECYVLAWNVAGLAPGLYHYDAGSDSLRRLRSGDLRRAAVRAASGQRWVGGAAFLCVMTAVFARTLWKYRLENAFRVLWMDAGHLGQTFDLLATARGLGPFQTAAIQDTFIEELIGVDGVKEFPVYLVGAGMPARPPRAAVF